jgi:hypothetical protein
MHVRVRIRSVAIPALTALALMTSMDTHAQRPGNGTAGVSGVVLGAGGASVVLHLRTLDDNPVRYYDGYEERAGKDGRFHFADIGAGTYRLEAEAVGLRLPKPEVLTLAAGEKRSDVLVALIPALAICGRATSNGAPVQARVTAVRYNPELGTFTGEGTSSEEDGSFRIAGVEPGIYFLRSDQTWYPGSVSFSGAKPIVVDSGANAACIYNIPQQYAGCSPVTVTGRIAARSNDSNDLYEIHFLERNAGGASVPGLADDAWSGKTFKAGEVFTRPVCAGDYDLILSDNQPGRAWSNVARSRVIFDAQHIAVASGVDLNILLTPRAMASVVGEVQLEGIKRYESCPGMGGQHVTIVREGDGEFQTVPLDDKNHFNFRNVTPGDYTIYLGPFLREAVYVKSILVDGKTAEGRSFTLADAKPATVVVTLSSDLKNAPRHISPDVRSEPRWEVAWTRPKGSVSGSVLGPGKSGATVKLRQARYNSPTSEEYTVQATEDGSFRFDKVNAGVYTLRVEGKSILTKEYSSLAAGKRGMPIVVALGAQIRGLTLSPPKLSAICGKVADSGGVLEANKRVWTYRNLSGEIHSQFPPPTEVTTDPQGRFRLEGLYPGDYFLASPLDVTHGVFFSVDGTFHTAVPVRVQAGEDVGCGAGPALELRAPADYKKSYAFGGKVSGDLPAKIGDRFWVTLLDVRSSGVQSFVATVPLNADHQFSFNRVPGGQLPLQLHGAYGNEPMGGWGPYGPVSHLVASQTIDVSDGLTDVTLTPMELPTVKGNVSFTDLPDSWKKTFDVTRQEIFLKPRNQDFNSPPPGAMLHADGSFVIDPVDIGDYEVQMQTLGQLHLVSVRVNGRETLGRYFHLLSGESVSMEVEVSFDASKLHIGQVTAHVVQDGSLPMPEPSVPETCGPYAWQQYSLVLLPDPQFAPLIIGNGLDSASLAGPRQFAIMWGDRADPKFQISVPPGHYRALAAQTTGIVGSPFAFGRAGEPTDSYQRLWNALAELGEPVRVQTGDSIEISLPDRSVDVERVAAKLGVPLGRGLFDR